MIKASVKDKVIIVDMLTAAFVGNKSVLYIVKKDIKVLQRIRKLMSYSFDKCLRSGDVFLSDDKNACALFLLPGKKKTCFDSIYADLKLIFTVTGIRNLPKLLKRERMINAVQPSIPFCHLWFIGVHPSWQGKGIGGRFMKELLKYYKNNLVCLETSTIKNIPWYQQFGFSIYNELNFGYALYCMKLENSSQ